jgi:hypothetical protein
MTGCAGNKRSARNSFVETLMLYQPWGIARVERVSSSGVTVHGVCGGFGAVVAVVHVKSVASAAVSSVVARAEHVASAVVGLLNASHTNVGAAVTF